MPIVITGANGQLGKALANSQPVAVQAVYASKAQLNICDAEAINKFMDAYKATGIINAAAYTAVDKAEIETDLAFAVNFNGAKNIAAYCKSANIPLVHISTDFVFDGSKNTPYLPTDATRPLGVYGKSKLAGEEAIFALNPTAAIVRSSWLYYYQGHNFVNTMLRLGKTKPALRVVYDQVGSPTYAGHLATALWHIVQCLQGVTPTHTGTQLYHYANTGVASWYDLAVQSLSLANIHTALAPILTADYPMPAERPAYSVLHSEKIGRTFNLPLLHWQAALQECLQIKNRYLQHEK